MEPVKAVFYKGFQGPVVVIVEEKHDSTHFVATTEAELHAIALYILTARFESGRFYEDPGPCPEAPNAIPQDVWDDMSDAMKALHREESEEYDHKVEEWTRLRQELKDIEDAVRQRDGFQAIRLLRSRSNLDYEHVHFERPKSSPEPLRDAPENPKSGQVWVNPVSGTRLQFFEGRWVDCTCVSTEANVHLSQGGRIRGSGISRDPIQGPPS